MYGQKSHTKANMQIYTCYFLYSTWYLLKMQNKLNTMHAVSSSPFYTSLLLYLLIYIVKN